MTDKKTPLTITNGVVGKVIGEAIERKKDKSKLAVMEYMATEMEKAKLNNCEPDWGEILEDSRKIWQENL